MAREWPFWSVYRKGIVVALAIWVRSLGCFTYPIWFVAADVRPHPWPFAAFFVLLVVSLAASRIFARCSECGKPSLREPGPYRRHRNFQRYWPEPRCSECGTDLSGGRQL